MREVSEQEEAEARGGGLVAFLEEAIYCGDDAGAFIVNPLFRIDHDGLFDV
ncbi:hypothetical protein G3I13_01925 [Streptomyces sp. SID6673]|nr:hypothetical protein [Streptomyces sp. SID11726]NDZ94920.1 hypothetical protein [Streptomyces sp. SID11726]NEB23079.1 hypothetical protein [Streptomyces sp. SID6673]